MLTLGLLIMLDRKCYESLNEDVHEGFCMLLSSVAHVTEISQRFPADPQGRRAEMELAELWAEDRNEAEVGTRWLTASQRSNAPGAQTSGLERQHRSAGRELHRDVKPSGAIRGDAHKRSPGPCWSWLATEGKRSVSSLQNPQVLPRLHPLQDLLK